MRAAVFHGRGDLRVETRPVPTIQDDQVLIEVSHCGVCGTDLHTVLEGWGRPGAVPGHELSGTVVEVGASVEDVAVGDRVAAEPQDPCGRCDRCREGRPSLCSGLDRFSAIPHGAFAEFTAVRVGQVRQVPDGVDLRTAALTEPFAVALHALTIGGYEPGQRVLVTGAGPIGLLAVAGMRAAEHEHPGPRSHVVVSEPAPARRERALDVGADEVVRPDALAIPDLPMHLVDEPFDLVLECAGRASAIEQGLANLRAGGTLVIVGAGLEAPRLDPNRILLNELVVTGAFNYDADGFERALSLLAAGRVPVDDLVEPEDVPLDGLLGAMQRLHRGELTRKVLVTPR